MSRIYDSSALTQRKRDLAQAGSFINRIQNQNNPQTSYGPLQGNYDASIMNSVKMGQPKEFYRNSGCIIISNGCPCPPIAVDEIISGSGPTPPVILAPGSVSNITVEYGSVIVRWDAPTEGGAPTSYTVSAIPPPGGTTITVTGVPTTTYSFATGALNAGTVYEMSVIGVNAAGNGSPPSSLSLPISGPFIAPVYTATSSEFFPNRIDITLTPYTTFTPTRYILKTYTNDVLTSTSSPTNYSSDLIVVNSGLSCLNVYSFQVQLFNNTQYSSFSVKGANVPVYPYGPDFLPSPNDITNITTTTAQVNYADYTIEGFDLTTGNAECILNSIPAIGYSNLTNTSVTLTGLIPGREYFSRSITISFRKTINGNVITSSPLSIPSFTTDNIIPGSVSNIIAIYGTTGTNVTWDAPTTGGTVASYTLFADDQTNSANSVTITGITDVSYTFPTYTGPAVNQLTAGDEYLFRVTAVNSAGSGTADVSAAFYAPYVAPELTSNSDPTDPNMIFINVIPYAAFTPTKYILKTYTNGTLTSTSSRTAYSTSSNSITINSGLSCLNVYAFQLQLLNDSDQYSSFTAQSSPPTPVYPAGPDILSDPNGVTNITSITAQVNYTDYTTTNGFDLTTGDAECIINPSGISYTQLTNTSVTLIGLTSLNTYDTLTIKFRKTINGNIITSNSSSVQSFKTIGKAPTNVSALAPEGGTITSSGNNATIVFDPYSSGTLGEFNFDNTSIVSIPSASPTIESIISSSEIYIGSLSFATIYTGCRLILKNTGGDISDPSNTFTIVTKSSAPTGVSQISSTQSAATCNLDSYGGFTGPITQIIAYDTSSGVPPYTTTYSVSIVSQTEFIISGLSESTSYTVGITISNGTYISMISPSFSVSTAGPPPPPPDAPAGIDTPLSSQGFTTQGITFNTYSESLISAVAFNGITGVLYGTITNLTNFSLTITGLSPGVEYLQSTVQVKVSNVSGESPPSNVPYFSTLSAPAPPANVQLGTTLYNTQEITFDSYAVPLVSASISGGTYGNTNLTQSGLTITGLTPQTYYSDLTVDVTNGGGTSGTSNIPPFTTSSYPSPNGATYTGTYDSSSGTVTATIVYNRYSALSLTAGTLFNNSGTPLGSFSSVTDTTLVITGVPINLSDTGCYITLTDGSFTTSQSNTFAVGTFIVTGARQGGSSSGNPNSNPITINYTVGSFFTPFNISSGTITVPGEGTFSINTISDIQAFFDTSLRGTYYNCSIILVDTSSIPTLPSNTFTIEITD